MSKKSQFGDLEPSMSYTSRQKRARRANIRFGCIIFLVMALITILALTFLHTIKCVQASGGTAYICGHRDCCENLSDIHNPNAPWVQ